MAGNSFNGDNWELDTAQSAAIFADGVFIQKCVWAPNAANNDLLIENADGDTICKTRAQVPSGSNEDEVGRLRLEEVEGFHRGFRLTTIDGGTLYVQIS
jgi:hypothetical protein